MHSYHHATSYPNDARLLLNVKDWTDRGTCILFGDGAGAVVLEATAPGEDPGLLGFALHSSGEGYCNLQLKFNSDFKELGNADRTVVDQGSYGKMTMNGAEVYKFAVNRVRTHCTHCTAQIHAAYTI